ncbi:hypothetical protein VB715_10855 [Crocosphaera sp. UHCC 0190]|uniref:hypothetical protein n=1 Tax=Crocosphaera sp. UHCC 0190 TaxID=3110246 RepID=UPI002B1EF655|nr:hypothetical protein [Crocosphaera sp. UHCC 0190]MEA5510261.1 hypothetical protein [Crocosphaera sp. UHCC 0190]
MMTEIDAELLEEILLFKASKANSSIAVLEWGCGRSSLYFPSVLNKHGYQFTWDSLENDREYFQEFASKLPQDFVTAKNVTFYPDNTLDNVSNIKRHELGNNHFHVFNLGIVRSPFVMSKPTNLPNGDAYVGLPSKLNQKYDIILVDGRYRRRCLIESASLMKPDGITLLHDAWRTYYHCAFTDFKHHRRIGEAWWIGSQSPLDFLVPVS